MKSEEELEQEYEDAAVATVRLAGGLLPYRSLVPLAFLASRAGIIDRRYLNFYLDRDFDLRCTEIERGYVSAYNRWRLRSASGSGQLQLGTKEGAVLLAEARTRAFGKFEVASLQRLARRQLAIEIAALP